MVDKILAENFEKRMEIVCKIAEFKRQNITYAPEREKKNKEKNKQYIKNEKLKIYYERFLQYCMDSSKEYQQEIRER